MRNARALAARLSETITDALVRAAEQVFGPALPQRQAQLVPVRVRRPRHEDRR